MRLRAVLALLGLAALGLALSACRTVGPDYRLPPSATVNAPAARGGFGGAQDLPAVSAAPLPPHWWRLYQDPKLDALVEEAFAANTDLRVAAANLERSRAMLAEARAARQPTLGLAAEGSYAQLSAEQYLQPGPLPPIWLYDAGLSLSYDLDLFGRLRRGVEAARADDEAVEAALDLARVNVAGEVTRAYVEVCAAGEELAAAGRSLALQQEAYALTERLVAAGRATRLDLERTQGQIEQFRASIPALRARQRAGALRLAVLAGRPPAEADAALQSCAATPLLSRPIPVGDGAALLARRPDVRAAERRLAAATAAIGVRTADLYPRVTLGASIGSTGLFSSFLGDATRRYGIGPGVRWALNTSAARARVEQAQAQARAELARFDGQVLTALREVETALNAYARDLDRNASLAAARQRAASAYADVLTLQRAGRGAALQTLDAERTLASTDAALAASRTQLAGDQVGLFLALGGGWE